MSTKFSLLALGLSLAACSAGTDISDKVPDEFAGPFASGTRLHAVVLGSPVGSEGRLQHFRDEELDIDCSFRSLGGEIRCLPAVTTNVGSYFADADCAQPALKASTKWSEGDLITSGGGPACGPNPVGGTPYRVGPVQSGVYELESGQCQPANPEPDEYHPLASAEVELFARAQMHDHNHVRRVISDDGAWMNLFARNDVGEACSAVGEAPHCVPAPFALGLISYFDNDRCESPNSSWAYTPEDCSWTPSWSIPVHGESIQLMPVYGPLEKHWRLDEASGHCLVSDDFERILRVGNPVPLHTFPIMEERLWGSGRIQVRFVGWDGDNPVSSGRLWDSVLEKSCWPSELANGTYCRPAASPIKLYRWADDCEGEQHVWRSEGRAPEFLIDSSGEEHRFFEAVEYTGSMYKQNDWGCSEERQRSDYNYYLAGEELVASEMPGWLVQKTLGPGGFKQSL